MPSRSRSRKTAKKSMTLKKAETGDVAYCVKCRHKRNMLSSRRVTTKKGRNMLKGLCPVCGTKMNKFI